MVKVPQSYNNTTNELNLDNKEQKYLKNKKITLVNTSSWQESLESGKKRKCDIFSLMADTQSRRKFLNYTEPYFSFPLVVATLNNKKFIEKLASIKDKKLSIVKGYL